MQKQTTILISRWIMMLIALLGPILQVIKYSVGMLTYYTTLSNFLVAGFSVYLVWAMQKGLDLQEGRLLRIKGAVTMAIMITFVIYHIMLRPLATDFWRVENIICHYITPLYFFFDTLLFDRQKAYRWFDPFLWTSIPLSYFAFALLNGYLLHFPIPNGKDGYFAYYFLNAPKYGWEFVIRSVIVIFIAYVLAGYVLYLLKSLGRRKHILNKP
ncbi:Pr6Pr family membrane protein [Streptococcus sp. DD13]|uniref:Pr6Pr family membrane protein n=1 Tax=Streptococcus sp. DD13 TaxID=1777881 RepID=UPI00083597B2|nr:Pr6Pr family membrane protein [Streptococcus sp. DD13]